MYGRRRPPRSLCVAALGAALCSGSLARAGAFSWTRGDGADQCPEVAAVSARFEEALRQPLAQALGSRSLDAHVQRREERWEVELLWRGARGATSAARTLRVSDPSCEAAVAAALSSALVVLRADALVANDAAVPPAPAPAPAPTPPPPPTPAPAAPEGPHVGDVLLGFATATGWLPGNSLGFQLSVEPVVWRRFRLQMVVTGNAEGVTPGNPTPASVASVAFGFEGCVAALRLRQWIEAALCGGFDGGVSEVFNYQAVRSSAGSSFAPAASATALLRSNPVGPFAFAVELGVRVPFVHWRITFADGNQLEQPYAAFTVGFRVGLSLSRGER